VLQFHGSQSDSLVDPGSRLFKLASKWLIQMSDAALVLSSEEQRQWQQFYPAGKFYVVSNPFHATSVRPSVAGKPAWGSPDGTPLLLFVGRLVEAKGIFDLLQAMPSVLARKACHLLVAGDGPQAALVRERVNALGLTDRVTLLGYLEGERLAEAYRAADIFVLPTYWNEGFPTVIAEAMNAGLPIVTTRIRGAADHLQEGVNALFVRPRDPGTLVEAINSLLADPAVRTRMGQANREKVKDFAPEVVGRRYLEVLEQIVEGAR
jgi:glycosyltransferase involved in cell wall biosynthesis